VRRLQVPPHHDADDYAQADEENRSSPSPCDQRVLVEQVKAAYRAYRELAERRGLTRLELVALGGAPERLPPVMAQSSQAGVDAAVAPL